MSCMWIRLLWRSSEGLTGNHYRLLLNAGQGGEETWLQLDWILKGKKVVVELAWYVTAEQVKPQPWDTISELCCTYFWLLWAFFSSSGCFSWMGASDECSGSSIEVCILNPWFNVFTRGLEEVREFTPITFLKDNKFSVGTGVWFPSLEVLTTWQENALSSPVWPKTEGWTTDLLRSFPTWNILRACVCRCSAPAFLKCLFGTTT